MFYAFYFLTKLIQRSLCFKQALKKDSRGLPETFSKRLVFDSRYRWMFIVSFIVLQGVVWCCSCCLGCVKCACGFGAAMLWATIKGMTQSYFFNMDPGTATGTGTLMPYWKCNCEQGCKLSCLFPFASHFLPHFPLCPFVSWVSSR